MAEPVQLNCGQLMWDALKVHYGSLILIVAPLIYLPVFLLDNTPQNRCLYVILLMFTYWVSECLPLPVTALFPMILFPLMGILDSPQVAVAYMKDTNMLFLGGLILAIAIEESGVHNRVALGVITLVGARPRLICLGLSLCTMFISMWISNTAALAMMIPIIDASLKELDAQGMCKMYSNITMPDPVTGAIITTPKELLKPSKISLCYFLTCCYSATLGGTGTIIGSGTNLVVKGIYETYFPDSPGVLFTSWMLLNVPIMLISTLIVFLYLQIFFMGFLRPGSKDAQAMAGGDGSLFMEAIKGRIVALGPWRFKEVLVAMMFIVAILLLVFREPQFIPGWPTLITEHKVKDGSVGILIAMALFILPETLTCIYMFSKNSDKRPPKESEPLITWKIVQAKMHWGIIFLLGGAFAMADGIIASGTGKMLADKLDILTEYSAFAIQATTCTLAMVITEFTSNVAIANILTPVLAELSKTSGVHPIYLCVPVGVFASYSFCMPVGTPPNALAKSAANIPTSQMFLGGLGVKIITFVLFIAIFNFYAPIIYGDLSHLPEWVNTTKSAINTRTCYDM